jgi:hypothetical protein
MNLRCIILLSALAWGFGWSSPATAQNAIDPAEWTLDFLAALNRNPDQTFQDFKAETYIGQTNGLAMEQFREAYRKNRNSFGISHSYELLAEQELGRRIKRVIAVLHHNKGAQLITFDFYRHMPGDGWQLMAYRLETNLQNFPWSAAPMIGPPATASRQ